MTVLLWIASIVMFVLLPAYAASRWAGCSNRVDRIEQAAYAYGGVAVTCWSLWVTSQMGMGRLGSLVGAGLVSVALLALAPPRRAPRASGGPTPRSPRTVWVATLVMVLLVVVPFLPYGWEGGDGIHRMAMSDWYKHLSVATALEAGEFPPANPFLIEVAPAPYYYGFHLLALPFQRLGVDPFAALLLWTLVTAGAFPVVLYLVAKGLFGDSRCAAVAAIGGSLLVGFDLVVWVAHAVEQVTMHWPLDAGMAGLRQLVPSAHLDSWVHHNERQFNPPYVAVIWAPHHLAAVMLSLLVLEQLRPGRTPSGRLPALPVLLLAALPALSAYVAVAFGAAVVLSCVAEARWQRCVPWQTDCFARWLPVALPGAVLSLPIVWGLAGSAGSSRLTLGVSSAGGILNGALFSTWLGDTAIPRLLDTPVLYLLELGVVGLLAVAAVRDRTRLRQVSAGQRQALFVVAALLVLVTFVRPPVGGPNNLYARPMLIVWALLAAFAADAWVRLRPMSLWVPVSGWVCVAGTVVAISAATVEGLLFRPASTETVSVARWINDHTADASVVAFRPPNRRFGYWLRRRTVAADRRHALLFGATGARYDAVARQLDQAYASASSADAHARFDDLGADVIVVSLPLPPWAQPPCFVVGFRGQRVAVVTAAPSGCVTPAR